jgi:catechol 2,3-dioxygenase-like lactoylglutathione lyase family enzyme
MIKSIDHIVLTSQDEDKTIRFYCDVLGMTLERFTPVDGSFDRLALCFGDQKINLHQASSPYVPHAQNPVTGAVDICFLSDTPIDNWIKIFREHAVPIEEGPTAKTGAMGPLWSIYIRDPDGNLIEISNQSG